MKAILPILFILSALIAEAQTGAPQKINYQAVARNSSGAPVANQNISVEAEILDANISTVLYAETHAVTTNQFGLFTIEVGGGAVISGSFAAINWGSGGKYIRTSVDLNAGSNYQVMGTSQFLSVPYALYAEKVQNNGGKPVIVLTDTITNAQAQAQIAVEYGPNTQEVRIFGCSRLTSVDLSMIKKLTGLAIYDNPSIVSVNLSNVTEITGTVMIDDCPQLATLNFSSLSLVYGDRFVNSGHTIVTVQSGFMIRNTRLTSLSFPALRKIIQDVDISSNSFLTSISFPALQTLSQQNASTNYSAGPVMLQFDHNSLSANQVNYLLNKFVSVNPALKSRYIYLNQVTAAPPTGQGINDKATLSSNNNAIYTD